MEIARRVQLYNDAHPNYPGISANRAGTIVGGTWTIGACYANPNPLYGAYPRGYLERVHSMFPDARRVLHAFSGGLTAQEALNAATAGRLDKTQYVESQLVDIHGPEQGRYPTWQGDLFDFCKLPAATGRFDLILADPPYSAEDAKKYGVKMPNRREVIHALREVAAPGANLVWLDQVWPQHKKTEWRTWAQIGLVRSTNHRMRLVTIMEAV